MMYGRSLFYKTSVTRRMLPLSISKRHFDRKNHCFNKRGHFVLSAINSCTSNAFDDVGSSSVDFARVGMIHLKRSSNRPEYIVSVADTLFGKHEQQFFHSDEYIFFVDGLLPLCINVHIFSFLSLRTVYYKLLYKKSYILHGQIKLSTNSMS